MRTRARLLIARPRLSCVLGRCRGVTLFGGLRCPGLLLTLPVWGARL